MSDRHYNSDDGEFVDFETLDDWASRDKAKDAEISRLRKALNHILARMNASAVEIEHAERLARAALEGKG